MLKNSTSSPHSVIACFVWNSEEAVIIFPYQINLLMFMT